MSTRIGERVRVRFAKRGSLRFISHIDLMRCWDRLVRRTGLPVRYSEGFHPKARFRWPLALGLGIEGLDELVEFELATALDAATVRASLLAAADGALPIASVSVHPRSAPCQVSAIEYRCALTEPLPLAERCAAFLGADSWPIVRRTPGKPDRPVDLRPLVLDLQAEVGAVRIRQRVTAAGAARPEEVLAALGVAADRVGLIVRTRVELSEP